MLPLFDEREPIDAAPEAPELEAAIAQAEALQAAGGWPYLMALREVNGWASGFYS